MLGSIESGSRAGNGSGAGEAPGAFERLALDVFAHQFGANPIYRAFCEARGATPATVARWIDIPAVPTDAFRVTPLVSGDPAAAEIVFRTSGTTAGADRRGAHYLLETDLYRAALLASFRRYLLPDAAPIRILSLIPSRALLPDSSLSFMIDEIVREFGRGDSGFFVGPEGLRMEELLTELARAAAGEEPVLIPGTSFAFVHLLDAMRASGTAMGLPHGSRVMDTGGFKGRSREVGRDELYASIEERLGVPAAWIVNEYGMTEMSSQFYDGEAGQAAGVGAARLHEGPPWVRSVAVDPETLAPVGDGEPGVLRHLDLANVHSVAAIQTADFGTVQDGRIELRGRASRAVARGCSIAMDEFLEVIGRSRA